MEPFEYITLSSWLSNADTYYLDARVLWLQISGITSGLVFMWFAMEHLMKTLVFQEEIKKGKYISKNNRQLLDDLSQRGVKFNHKFTPIIKAVNESISGLLNSKDIKVLKNVHLEFETRYPNNKKPGRIEIKMLNELDEIFFKLRDQISSELPESLIDLIDDARNSRIYRLGDYTKFAYLNNPHFHKRAEHR